MTLAAVAMALDALLHATVKPRETLTADPESLPTVGGLFSGGSA